jgi:hypothetical protein
MGIAAKPTDSVPWRVPVCAKEPGGGSACVDLAGAHGTLELKTPACPAWVLPNVGSLGYYRTSLSEGDLRALARNASSLDVPSRVGFVSDLWAQVRAGTLAPDVMLQILPVFDRERDGHVVKEIIDALYGFDNALVEDVSRFAFRGYVQQRMMAHKARLGWQPKAGDDDDTAMLRPQVLMLLGDVGRERTTLHEAEAIAKTWLKDPASVDPDVAPVALRLSAIHAGPARLDELRAAARAAKTPHERIAALEAITMFEDPAVRPNAFDAILSDDVKMQDLRYLLRSHNGRSAVERAQTARALFDWISTHWESIHAKLPGSFGASYLVDVVGGACSIADRDEEVAFFQSHVKELEGAQRPLYENAELATSCSELRARGAGVVTAFLKK